MIFVLCAAAFLAGFIDSVAGGGGLIQVPALFICLPSAPIPLLLGINKFSSFCGTSISVLRYSKNVSIPWKLMIPGMIVALLFSFLGARAVSHLPSELIRPFILVLLFGVFLFTLLNKNFGSQEKHKPILKKTRAAVVLGCAIIGFYDGFLGPGTGGFLIFFFVFYLGMNFLKASASAKLINWSTNIAALTYFAAIGMIDYRMAVPMAAANIGGNYLGSHLAIKKGSPFIRFIFLWVVSMILLKLAFDFIFK
ncbi:MAG: sulfite exporter TauE/SafE family protein [Deltaproteobacteria bacterium]|nr:sulfite exporter TauE/SafE family protein [Deltaproteobacteria bacterium]